MVIAVCSTIFLIVCIISIWVWFIELYDRFKIHKILFALMIFMSVITSAIVTATSYICIRILSS